MSTKLDQTLGQIQVALRTCAEKDRNDVIANAASALAARLESYRLEFGPKTINDVEKQLIRYALANFPVGSAA
jgi:hypothetical protein